MNSFASDNNAPVHPEVLNALNDAGEDDCIAYGDDKWTEKAKDEFKVLFGGDVDTYFVFNGTGANILSLSTLTNSFNSVLCADTAHINVDECGAPEKFGGFKLLTVPNRDGKIISEDLDKFLSMFGNIHHSQPKIVSISQTTELGTVYTPKQVNELSNFTRKHNMYLHMDGARIANAAAALGKTLKELTWDCGVDVLSFGGTKNGLMFGEAVVFMNPQLSENVKYYRKQAAQVASKMRYISVQFSALFKNDLWLKNASHANQMAKFLADEVSKIEGVRITRPVQANAVFAILSKSAAEKLRGKYFFYNWDETTGEVRWMTSWRTNEESVKDFVKEIQKCTSKASA